MQPKNFPIIFDQGGLVMATVYDVKLTIDNPSSSNPKVTVTYKVKLTSVERFMQGLRFKEVIRLYGDDTPKTLFEDGVDDNLFAFPTGTFISERDGIVERRRSMIVKDDVLNEDKGPVWWLDQDEIYARVCVYPQLPTGSCRVSNTVRGNF
jgi:hypothetical protein